MDRIKEPAGKINFGVIHYDTICSPFRFYVFYLEIYVGVFLNFVSKNIMNLNSDAINKNYFNQINLSNYKKNF